MKTSPATGLQLLFRAELQNWAAGMDYCAIAVPSEITEALGTKGPVLVEAQVDDSDPFQVSLFPVGGGRHYIRVQAKVRQQTNTTVGDRIRVRITVLDRADIAIPDDLMRALGTDGLTEAFRSLPPGKKRFIIRQIGDAVRPETRESRIDQAVIAAQKGREKSTSRP